MNDMNKKTYMLPGDERIVAGNAEEFVRELRQRSWMDSECTDEEYMHNFAERYVIQAVCGLPPTHPRTSSPTLSGRDMPKPCDTALLYYCVPVSFSWEMGIFYRPEF